jgi:hypothetical protein
VILRGRTMTWAILNPGTQNFGYARGN